MRQLALAIALTLVLALTLAVSASAARQPLSGTLCLLAPPAFHLLPVGNGNGLALRGAAAHAPRPARAHSYLPFAQTPFTPNSRCTRRRWLHAVLLRS